MHEFSLTFHKRRNVYYFLSFVASILYSKIIFTIGDMSKVEGIVPVSMPGTVTLLVVPVSGFVIFGLLFAVFDQYVWKWPYVTKFIQVPDIEGKWEGTLNSSKDDKERNVELNITQTYSKIIFSFDTPISNSQSKMALIEKIGQNEVKLRWEYFADPKEKITKNNFSHHGVTKSTIVGQNGNFKTEMTARYYTESERDSSGSIHLTFIK